MTQSATGGAVIYHGMVAFDFAKGVYSRASGQGDWTVRPIDWPGLPQPPALGQVLIEFSTPIDGPYTVVVSANRTPDAPMLSCNYGNVTANGFEVILFNPVAVLSYQTVRNGNFSFLVVQ
jgi:hypothetical protein